MKQNALFHTRITELFGIRLPIFASGLQWLARAEYVAAAVNAGLMGFLSATSFDGVPALRAEITRCRQLADGKPFGVNLSMLPQMADDDAITATIALLAAEKIPFIETAGRDPATFLPRLHDNGIRVVHKVASLRHALKAQQAGVDAIILVGAEAGGHPGAEPVGTLVQGALAAEALRLPFLCAGGIGHGAQIIAALALGADGVAIGSRFLVASEIQAHPDYKARLLAANEHDTALILHTLGNPMRALRNDTTASVAALERELAGQDIASCLEQLMPHVSGELGRQAYQSGDTRHGALSLGQSVAFAHRVEPLADIVSRLEAQARTAASSLSHRLACPPD